MSATNRTRRTRLNVELLDARTVPATLIELNMIAHVSGGNLVINGGDQADTVRVTTSVVGGQPSIVVTQNGVRTSFPTKDVTGRIEFLGGGGNDTFTYTGTKDIYADGGAGNDVIRTGSGNDELIGRDGDDYLSAGDGNDRLDGGAGNNELWGGRGNDWLSVSNSGKHSYLLGGAGNDTLIGGQHDYFAGGTGADKFDRASRSPMIRQTVAATFTRSLPGGSGIADFNAKEGDSKSPERPDDRAVI